MDISNTLEHSLFAKYVHIAIPCAIILILFIKRVLNRHQGNMLDSYTENVNEVQDFSLENETNHQPSLEEKDHITYRGASKTLPGGARQFYELVNDRRSVRSFKSQPIPAFNLIEDCIRAAGTSPSGAHTEPWRFCIISTSEMKEQIRCIIESEEELNYTHRMHRQWTADLRPLKTNHIKPYLTDAPYLILVFKQTYSLNRHGKRKQHYYNEISVSISVGILLCALQSCGLSSLVTTPLNCGAALRMLLKRPANEKLLVLLPVGYASDNCKIPDLNRKSLNEIFVNY